MDRLETGVLGLDPLLSGGLPRGSIALVAGPPGSGKTLLATQAAFYQARQDKQVLILTALAGPSAKLLAQIQDLSYFDSEVVGRTLQIQSLDKLIVDEGLESVLTEVRKAVADRRVELVVLDSLTGLHALLEGRTDVMRFLSSLGSALFLLGCTAICTLTQFDPDEGVTEQTICDVIIGLDTEIEGQRAVRHLQVVEMRGGSHQIGRYPYELTNQGMMVVPEPPSG